MHKLIQQHQGVCVCVARDQGSASSTLWATAYLGTHEGCIARAPGGAVAGGGSQAELHPELLQGQGGGGWSAQGPVQARLWGDH